MGIYSKEITRWNTKMATDCTIWENLRNHMIAEYEKLLAEGHGTTLAQEGYVTMFHATEDTNKNASLTESIVEYAERATVAERKMSNLENRLSMMEMNGPPTLAAQKYYAPEMAYLTNAQPPPPETVQLPPQQQPQLALQHQHHHKRARKCGNVGDYCPRQPHQ